MRQKRRRGMGVYRINYRSAFPVFLIICMFAIIVVMIAAANRPPVQPTRALYVSDFANVLTVRQRNFILETSRQAAAETGVDIAVLTVRNHRGFMTIEEFAWQNAVGWGLGGEDNSQFVLLVYNLEDSRVFIASGTAFTNSALAFEAIPIFVDNYMRGFYANTRRGRGEAVFEGYKAMVLYVYAQMGMVPSADMLETLIPGPPQWIVWPWVIGAAAGAAVVMVARVRRRRYN